MCTVTLFAKKLICTIITFFATGAFTCNNLQATTVGRFVLKSTYSTYNVVSHNYSLFLPFFSAETNDFLTDFLTLLSLKMKFCLNKSCRSAASFFDKQAKEAVVEKHTNLPVPPSCAINAQKKITTRLTASSFFFE